MDQHEYTGLISRLEAQASHNPTTFRTKVLLLSGAAYFVLFGALAGSALLIYSISRWTHAHNNAFYFVQLGLLSLAVLPLFLLTAKMFFMRLKPPTGRPLTPEEAPRLFEVLRKMRKKLKGPPIHHVLVDREYNAAISQIPKFGLFGMHKNYLIIGLPYLLGASAKEMLATVGHEYGHLCGNHGKLCSWVYRQRRTLGAVYERIQDSENNNVITETIRVLLHKLMPYYNAYTFVMARQDEYDADRTAADLVGADITAMGLVRGELLGRWVDKEFWPKLYMQANASAEPSFKPFGSMRAAFRASHDQWATRETLAAAWRTASDFHDTHPCLRDRIEATGQPASLPGLVEKPAADALLGDTAKILIKEFDESWWNEEKSSWQARYRYATRSKIRLNELEGQRLDDLPLHDLQELSLLKSEFESAESAKPVLEHLMRRPGGPYPKPEYLYGRILLDENNDRGLDYLSTAARCDRSLTEEAAEAGYFYLLNKHGEQTAELWWSKVFPQ